VSDTEANRVLIRREAQAGCITLNHPEVRNILDGGMLQAITAAVADWRDDDAVKLVVLDAAGDAFCPGGDVEWLHNQLLTGRPDLVVQYLAGECALYGAIAAFGKPWVSLIDGFCFGSGMGLSVHGSHRIVTDYAAMAMPEAGIGFFPDAGMGYVLPRLPGALGMWLGLTGARLSGRDAVHAGLATHLLTRNRLAAFRSSLVETGDPEVVAAFAEPLREPRFAAYLPAVNRCYAAPSVPAILAALEAEDTNWARREITALRRMSPTSLFVTHALLRLGATQTLSACLQRETALVGPVLVDRPDFREGVRALLVDRDRTPRWQPATIEDVDPAVIAALFSAAAGRG
jgi:enoyl-CoA hydratase/carnithine racemase